MSIDSLKVMVTDTAQAPADGTLVQTPTGQPNLIIQVMTPIAQVLVRGGRTFFQSFVGFLIALTIGVPVLGSAGIAVPIDGALTIIISAAGLSVMPTVISLAQNSLEMFTAFDSKFPKARA